MDRKALALKAYNKASERTMADASLSPVEKRAKYIRLANAFERRKEAIRLSAFLRFHRLDRILGTLTREHEAGMVGATAIQMKNERAA